MGSPADRAFLEVRVTPRAATERVGPWIGGMLAVRVTRPAADGEANAAMLRLVARAVGVPAGRVRIAAGERSRRKRLLVDGLTEAELRERLRKIGQVD